MAASLASSCRPSEHQAVAQRVEHIVVYSQEGRFAAWPANGGIWQWDDEILVGFVEAKEAKTNQLHTYDQSTARHKFARSLDGGQTWSIEDAYDAGHTARAYDHTLNPSEAEQARDLEQAIDFAQPGFVFTFVRLNNNHDGPSIFYHSYDKGKTWKGPHRLHNMDTAGIATRNDYLVESEKEMAALLTVAKQNKLEGRVAVARTADGGLTWKRTAWIGPEPAGFDIMPSTVRLSSTDLFTAIRTRNADRSDCITAYASSDNGQTWQRAPDPVADTGHGGSPPALVKLEDGRLALAYAFRSESGSRLCIRFSPDNGQSWTNEILLRAEDGANRDVGYPAMIQRPDGKLVVVYYWNHSLKKDASPHRYIAATIFDPGLWN